jgi:hypothetical protein
VFGRRRAVHRKRRRRTNGCTGAGARVFVRWP